MGLERAMGRCRQSTRPVAAPGAVALVVLAIVGLSACSADERDDGARAADSYATAVADELADSEQGSRLVNGDVHAEAFLMGLASPRGVEEIDVLDVSVPSRTDDAGNTEIGVDAAVAMTFAGGDGATCVLVSATSTGGTSAAVAAHIPLNECSHRAENRLRDPFQTAQEMFNSH